jgi:hypothetical protein
MRAEEIVFYGTDWKDVHEAWLRGDDLRPAESQAEFSLSESDRTMFEIYDDGNLNEYGWDDLDWPTE